MITYSVTQRTREIGIRIALGAQPADVLKMVMGQSAILTLAGLGLGLIVSLTLARTLSGFLFSVSPNDPLTLVAGSLTLWATAMAATLVPALRAVRIDPLVALRYE